MVFICLEFLFDFDCFDANHWFVYDTKTWPRKETMYKKLILTAGVLPKFNRDTLFHISSAGMSNCSSIDSSCSQGWPDVPNTNFHYSLEPPTGLLVI